MAAMICAVIKSSSPIEWIFQQLAEGKCKLIPFLFCKINKFSKSYNGAYKIVSIPMNFIILAIKQHSL
jgi:hypothetical protein